MKSKAGIFINSLLQAGVRVLASVCALLLTWLIARHSVDDLGVFRTLFVYFLISESISLLGMQTYLVREISLHPDRLGSYVLHALVFSLAVAVIAFVGLNGLALFGGYSLSIREGLYIVAASLPATAAFGVALSMLVGTGKTMTLSLVQGLETIGRTGAGIVFVSLGWGVLPAIAAMAVIRWLVVIGLWKKLKPAFAGTTWRWDKTYFREFLGHVPTFMGITLLAMVLRFAAQIMLPWVIGDAAAGQFAAAYLFVDMALLVPTAMVLNLSPLLARKAQESTLALVNSCRQGIKVMLLGVMPFAAILCVIAGPMFSALFPHNPAYEVSARVLSVIIWICCLQVIDVMLSITIVSTGKQHIDLQSLSVGAICAVAFLGIGIPVFGIMGAAFGLVAAFALQVIVRFILVSRELGRLHPWSLVWRPLVAAVAGMVAAHFIQQFHWLAGAMCGGLVYLVMLVAVGTFTVSERESFGRFLHSGKT